MKKIFLATIFILIIGTCLNCNVKAKDIDDVISIDDFDLSDSNRILRENGYTEISVKEIINNLMSGNVSDVFKKVGQTVYDKTIGNFDVVKRSIINLVLVVVLSAFFTNFATVFSKDNVSETGFYICYLVAITIMVTLFESFCILTADFVKMLVSFMYGIVPAYFLSVAVLGQVSAAGFYQLTLTIIAVCEFAFLHIIIPLIKVYVAINLVNNISKEDFLSKMADVIKNIIGFINKFMIGTVAGLNIIQGLILPAVDGAKNTTIRKFVGSLPVVGGGTDALTSIVLGSANLIKNTIGGFMILIIVVICIVPFIKIQMYSFGMQIAAAIVQPVADNRIIDSFSCICTGTKLLAKVIVGASFLFIISIAIICMVTGKG